MPLSLENPLGSADHIGRIAVNARSLSRETILALPGARLRCVARNDDVARNGDQAFAFAALREPFLAAASSAGFLRSISSIEPPAFSTASRAPFDTPATLNASLALSSPFPRSRTPSLPPRARPATLRLSWSRVPLVS